MLKLTNEHKQFFEEEWSGGNVMYTNIARAFNTHFGLNENPEKFRHRIRRHLQGCENPLIQAAIKAGISPEMIKGGNVSQKDDNGNKTHIRFGVQQMKQLDEMRLFGDNLLDEMKNYKVKYPKIKRNKIKDGHLLVVDPADIHIGKLCTVFGTGNEYNVDIAISQVKEAIESIVSKSQGFNIDKVIFVMGNDILHTDNNKPATTKGTPQETCGLRHENAMRAKQLYVWCIEALMQIADVECIYCPSNHDLVNGFFLTQCVADWFRLSKNVSFQSSPAHYKYTTYGNNFLMFTHGDGAPIAKLQNIASDKSDLWKPGQMRYGYLHHLHHKKYGKPGDGEGMTFEYLRSPSGTDTYHHIQGYIGAKKAIEAFIHHPVDGQIARFTHNF